jgi:N-acylneuraminate cytidylyltransferase
VPNKNIRNLCGHPLLAYTIQAALESNIFDAVICATDSAEYADIARHYGAEVPFLRPPQISGDKSPDIEWVVWMLTALAKEKPDYDVFSILRPTSPLRLPETIRRAWEAFTREEGVDSLRAVEKCAQHPGKMWVIDGSRMRPLLPHTNGTTPWHSSQYAALPPIYVQNASLEIAWSRTVFEQHSIAGEVVVPFISQGLEGFDINTVEDWLLIEHYLATGEARLPVISTRPYPIEKQ